MLNKLYRHFFDLGIYPEKDDFHLGPRDRKIFIKRTLWEVLIYSLMVLGIICREYIKVNPLGLDFNLLNWKTVGAALIVGTPFFPSLIRKVTKRKPQGGLEYVIVPFAYGFSINVAVYLIKGNMGTLSRYL